MGLVEAFREQVQALDQEEAYVINEHFDSPAAQDLESAERLEYAIEQAHADPKLTPSGSHAEVLGYQVARDAIGWLDYRAAHLQDFWDSLKEKWAGTSFYPPDGEAQWFDKSQRNLQESRDRFFAYDPIYVSLFAALGRRRALQERRGYVEDESFDLESLECEYAIKGLANTCEKALRSPQAIQWEGGSYVLTGDFDATKDTNTCQITHHPNGLGHDHTSAYELEVLGPRGDRKFDPHKAREVRRVYLIRESPKEGITISGQREYRVHSLLRLIHMILPDEAEYSFDRPQAPAPFA